jgi:Protein of unknown function (DUF3306)
MSERETFLARWSRRKHAALAEPAGVETSAMPAPSASEEPTEGATGALGDHVAATDLDAIAPLFDPASLPPIESIAADTDIRAFLAPGVPPELARAALRRAWAADPKIRDFVGLADYDWDFNAPRSMAGFGPLEMTEELRQIAARIMGPPPAADAAESSDLPGQAGASDESLPTELARDMTEQEEGGRDPFAESDPRPDATEKSQIVVQPRHGGALPK